jgi:hypothetical protein
LERAVNSLPPGNEPLVAAEQGITAGENASGEQIRFVLDTPLMIRCAETSVTKHWHCETSQKKEDLNQNVAKAETLSRN